MQIRESIAVAALTGVPLAAFGGMAQARGQDLKKPKQMKVATTDIKDADIADLAARSGSREIVLKKVT